MFRLLGFLVGSAAAITILLLLLGVPDFHLPDAANDRQRFDAAVEKLREKQQDVQEVAETVVEEVAAAAEVATESLEAAAEKAVPEAAARVDAARQNAAAEDPPPATDAAERPPSASEFDALESDPAFDSGQQWYSFWNPFRSELAANGFKSQLEKVTGLDYRVVKVKTGVYEVAFAYADDAERRSKLAQIALATGLNLPGS